jgi:hypothetical protein
MERLAIQNKGPLIVQSNFWEMEFAKQGLYYLSINAGVFRLLVPETDRELIPDMKRGAKHVVISMLIRGKWQRAEYCMEFMIEDSSDDPWSCHFSPGQIDRAPSRDSVGKQWAATVWNFEGGKPVISLELPAYFQIVPELPWLKNISK